MPVDPFPFDPPSSLPSRAAAYVARRLLFRLPVAGELLTLHDERATVLTDGVVGLDNDRELFAQLENPDGGIEIFREVAPL